MVIQAVDPAYCISNDISANEVPEAAALSRTSSPRSPAKLSFRSRRSSSSRNSDYFRKLGSQTSLPPSKNPSPARADLINQRLPREVMLKIFAYLDVPSKGRCAAVCKRWNSLANDGDNWRRVDLFEFRKPATLSVVRTISKRAGSFLTHLNLRGCVHLTDNSIDVFILGCGKNLSYLNISRCSSLSESSLDHITEIAARGALLQNLRNFSASNVKTFSDYAIGRLLRTLSFTSLDLSWTAASKHTITALASRLQENLVELRLSGCSQINDENLYNSALPFSSKQMKVLQFQNTSSLTDNTLSRLLTNSAASLESLNLGDCSFLSDRSLIFLAERAHNLKTFEIGKNRRISNSGVDELVRQCQKISKLDFECCSRISDASLVAIGENLGAEMEQLIVSFCDQITNHGLETMLRSCGKLRRLDCDSCFKIGDSVFTVLPSTIRWLGVLDCHRISHSAIVSFKHRVPRCEVHAFYSDKKTNLNGVTHTFANTANAIRRSDPDNISSDGVRDVGHGVPDTRRFRTVRNNLRSCRALSRNISKTCCVIS